jgi:hypothetical protein
MYPFNNVKLIEICKKKGNWTSISNAVDLLCGFGLWNRRLLLNYLGIRIDHVFAKRNHFSFHYRDRGIKTGHREFNTKYNKFKGYQYIIWISGIKINTKGVKKKTADLDGHIDSSSP